MTRAIAPAWAARFSAQEAARTCEPVTVSAARERAFHWFLEHGFPTTRDEEWKYSDVHEIATYPWCPSGSASSGPQSRRKSLLDNRFVATTPRSGRPSDYESSSDDQGDLAPLTPSLIVLLNGRPDSALATCAAPGVRIEPVGEAIARDVRFGELFASSDALPADGFAALNLALAEGGLAIEATTLSPGALHLAHVAVGANDSAVLSRHVLIVRSGASLDLIESHLAIDDATSLASTVLLVHLEAGATLRHSQLFLDGDGARRVASTEVMAGPDARYECASILLGGAFTRADVSVTLGPGAGAAVHGLRILRDHQHADHAVRIAHRGARTQSRVVFRTIADEQARGVVSARAVVEHGANGANAAQDLRNLLLSPEAEVDNRPRLEIYADDVQCRHGAATGSLDPEALYYLRTRGLDEAAARRALMQAFVRDIVGAVETGPVKDFVELRVAQRLGGAP